MSLPRTALLIASGLLATELPNLLREGRRAPRWSQRIWIDPRRVERCITGWRDRDSAQIIDGDWRFLHTAVADLPKIRACHLHFGEGIPWRETGIYEHMINSIEYRGNTDGCATISDIVARYERVDRMYDQVRTEGRLRPRSEVARFAFRELGGVRIHLFRGGEPVFSGTGGHRLAICQLLGVKSIPAQLGVVHPEALTFLPDLTP